MIRTEKIQLWNISEVFISGIDCYDNITKLTEQFEFKKILAIVYYDEPNDHLRNWITFNGYMSIKPDPKDPQCVEAIIPESFLDRFLEKALQGDPELIVLNNLAEDSIDPAPVLSSRPNWVEKKVANLSVTFSFDNNRCLIIADRKYLSCREIKKKIRHSLF